MNNEDKLRQEIRKLVETTISEDFTPFDRRNPASKGAVARGKGRRDYDKKTMGKIDRRKFSDRRSDAEISSTGHAGGKTTRAPQRVFEPDGSHTDAYKKYKRTGVIPVGSGDLRVGDRKGGGGRRKYDESTSEEDYWNDPKHVLGGEHSPQPDERSGRDRRKPGSTGPRKNKDYATSKFRKSGSKGRRKSDEGITDFFKKTITPSDPKEPERRSGEERRKAKFDRRRWGSQQQRGAHGQSRGRRHSDWHPNDPRNPGDPKTRTQGTGRRSPFNPKLEYFSIVRSYQLGRLDENSVSSGIKFVSELLDEQDVLEILKQVKENPDFNVREFLDKNAPVYSAKRKERLIKKLAHQRSAGNVNGEPIDNFSAFMISKVLDKLNPDQKFKLLGRPMGEVTAISYKLAARSEF